MTGLDLDLHQGKSLGLIQCSPPHDCMLVSPPGSRERIRVAPGRPDLAALIASGTVTLPRVSAPISLTSREVRLVQTIGEALRPVMRDLRARLDRLETEKPAPASMDLTSPVKRDKAAVLARAALVLARAEQALRRSSAW